MRYSLTIVLTMLLGANLSAADLPYAATDGQELVKGNNDFAIDLYDQLKGNNGNLFFSPASISTALAMTYAGARGDMATQMASTLHFTLDQAHLHPAMAALLHNLNQNGEAHGYTLKIANALWAQSGYAFDPGFKSLVKNSYDAGIGELDFAHAAEAARVTINGWVEDHTAHKITDLIPPGTLGNTTRLVLTNAVYFKGSWANAFDKDQTQEEDFHLTSAQTVKTRLMHRTGKYQYYENDSFQALALPYKGDDLSMLVLLPHNTDSMPIFEPPLTSASLEDVLGKLQSVDGVQLTLPVFKVTEQFSLNGVLKALGIQQAFSPQNADFSGMDAKRDLFISDVIHKAYVDVNEEGTEAAAATAVVMKSLAVALPAHQPPVFKADHPFVFFICDNSSGSILFMGRLSDPTQAQ